MVAYDAGPCAAFKMMLGRWPDWHGFLLQAGKAARPTGEELQQQIRLADVVLVGLSSKRTADFELEACRQTVAAGKSLAFFSDTFGSWARPWFVVFRDYVSLVTVVVDSEVPAARAIYPNAQVVATGNPTWEQFHESGYRGSARLAMGAKEKESVFFISGCKDYSVNCEMLSATFEAVRDVELPRVVFSKHPGDQTLSDKYVQQMNVSPPEVNFTYHSEHTRPGEAIICGADVVIVYNAASIAMRAVALQLPLVVLRTPLAAARFLEESESEVNPILQARAAVDGGMSASSLGNAFREVIGGVPAFWLVTRQKKFFPTVSRGAYVNALRNAVKEMVIPASAV